MPRNLLCTSPSYTANYATASSRAARAFHFRRLFWRIRRRLRLCARFTARIRLRRLAMCSFHCAHTPPIARAAVYCRSKIETADRFRLARNHSIGVLQNYDINVIHADKMERVHAEWRKIWMNDAPMATQSSKPAIDRATMAFWSCSTMSSGVASVMRDVRRE